MRVGAGARSALTAYRSDTSVVPGTLVPLPNVAALREGVRAFLPAFRVAPPDVQRGHKGLYGFLCAASSEDAGDYPQYFGRDADGLPTGEWHASRALGVSSSFLASVRSFYDADADYRAGVVELEVQRAALSLSRRPLASLANRVRSRPRAWALSRYRPSRKPRC